TAEAAAGPAEAMEESTRRSHSRTSHLARCRYHQSSTSSSHREFLLSTEGGRLNHDPYSKLREALVERSVRHCMTRWPSRSPVRYRAGAVAQRLRRAATRNRFGSALSPDHSGDTDRGTAEYCGFAPTQAQTLRAQRSRWSRRSAETLSFPQQFSTFLSSFSTSDLR